MDRPDTHRSLLWFRRNLRIDDQPLFDDLSGHAIGVWVLDPRELLVDDPLGFPRCGDHRLRFILESVSDLRAAMRSLGSDLVVRVGEPEAVLPELATQLDATRLRFVREPGTEERSIEKRVAAGFTKHHPRLAVDALPPETLFDIDEPMAEARELPEVFSKWRRRCEKHRALIVPTDPPTSLTPIDRGGRDAFDPGAVPSLRDLDREEPSRDPRAALEFKGGASAGLQRVDQWIFRDDRLKRYKETRNGLLGEAYSSKFSPWLALGCLSPRRIAERTLAYERERVSNDSTYWLRFELMWRAYFRLYLFKHRGALFHLQGPQQIALPWSDDAERFAAWQRGETGLDFIDANMRELSLTGFMSNRGRQNVASFLAKNLGIDWRWGARWFESCLMDYCPAANWGNWAYAAGVGADPRGFRGFNVVTQANRYDPDGTYADHWLSDRAQRIAPIVDPAQSLADAEARWHAATR